MSPVPPAGRVDRAIGPSAGASDAEASTPGVGPVDDVAKDRHWTDGDPVAPAIARAFTTVWDHLVVADEPIPSDALFCFGSRDRRVVPVAAELFRRAMAPVVLVTGGPAGVGAPTEGEQMAAGLVAAGVPGERVLIERTARHTGENVTLGAAVLGQAMTPRRVLLVSWPLAARRCRATFTRWCPGVEVGSVPALARPGARWAPTAKRIALALGELDRLDRYAAAGLVTPQPISDHVRAAVDVLRDGAAPGAGGLSPYGRR